MASIMVKGLQREPRNEEIAKWIIAAENDEAEPDEFNQLTKAKEEKWEALPKERKEFFTREARKLHVKAGHRPVHVLIGALRRRGAPLEATCAMKLLTCSAGSESQAP